MSSSTVYKPSGPYVPAFNSKTFKNSINGKLVDTEKHTNGINPATLENLPDVPVSTKEDLDFAVDSARTAFKLWSKTPYADRKVALLKFADVIEAAVEDLTDLLTTEQGKPTFQATSEVASAAKWIRVTTNLGDVGESEIIEDTAERKIYTRYTPLGVVGGIVPWNFPVQLFITKVAPAVITGNTIIIKPSPYTPYCSLKLAELAQSCFPPGVVQCLSGDDQLGPWITAHPGIDKISFTGSTATGKVVAAISAKTLKRVTLELGGNDPAIVCADVDIASTAAQIATCAFMNSGQICVAVKRVYIHESIYDEFRDAIVIHSKNLTTGNGKENVFCGPIQNKMQYERVQGFFADIENEKQKIAYGSKEENKTGYYINPTIIDNPSDDSRLVVEEPFGPILPIMRWKDEDEVIARANNTKMGLGASVWSRDPNQAERLALQIEAGCVWINKHLDITPNAPFGGHKESGIGIEAGLGGLKGMCNIQTINLKK